MSWSKPLSEKAITFQAERVLMDVLTRWRIITVAAQSAQAVRRQELDRYYSHSYTPRALVKKQIVNRR
jgi:hypothetical protein